jgi:hypothetical protein
MKPANPLEPHADSFVQLHPSRRDLVRVTVRRGSLEAEDSSGTDYR